MDNYLIFDSFSECALFLDILNRNLKLEEVIQNNETWDKPHKVGSQVNRESLRYWLNSPRDEWMIYAPRMYSSTTNDNPDFLEENLYKIYQYINEDTLQKIHNFLCPPMSFDYKKDVNVRFATKETFDVFGNLVHVSYYDSQTVEVNAIGVKTITYGTLILEASFIYTYEADGYLNYRMSTREWYTLDDVLNATVTKQKFYDVNSAKKAGERRRKNVQNMMEQKVGTGLFLTKGSPLVGGDGTFTTVADADTYGRPLLNSFGTLFSNFVSNNEHVELLQAILDIDLVEFPWVLGIDPYTGSTIQQVAYKVIEDSVRA